MDEHSVEMMKKIQIIQRQTDYSEDVAREKLQLFGNDEIVVIKDYFGINVKKEQPIKSINQEIYKQMRTHLNSAMKDYNERVEKGEAKKLL